MAAMTSAELIRAIAKALFGDGWQANDLATALKVGTRTIRRWVDGTADPPSGVWSELLTITVKRAADLSAIIPELERRAGDR
jgi:hypothetical protein